MIFKTVCVHQIYALRLCVLFKSFKTFVFSLSRLCFHSRQAGPHLECKDVYPPFRQLLNFCCEFSHYPCNRYSSSILYSILFYLNSVCILVLDTSISVLRQRLRSEVIELPLEYTAPISQRPYYRFPLLNSFQIISISQSISQIISIPS